MGAWPQQVQPGGSRVSSIKRLELTPSWRPPPFLITRHHVNKKLGRGLERHRGDADPRHYSCARVASSPASWAWQRRPGREADGDENGVVERVGTSSRALARASCAQ